MIKEWWTEFVRDIDKAEHWVRLGILMLKLFNENVGIANLVSLPIQMGALANPTVRW